MRFAVRGCEDPRGGLDPRSARFSVDGGTWQTIPETVTINGDPISRYVAEAEARLSEMN